MNLKQAASRLDVHYQTAHRWVRNGRLAAVRLGSRYEISEQAVRMCASSRSHSTESTRPSDIQERRQHLAEISSAAQHSVFSPIACFRCATRSLTTDIADISVICLTQQRRTVSWSRDPVLRDSVPVLVDMVRIPATDLAVSEVTHCPHIPQDEIESTMNATSRLIARDVRIYSAASAPLTSRGRVAGSVSAYRTSPGRPFSEPDLRHLASVAEICTDALTATSGSITRSDL